MSRYTVESSTTPDGKGVFPECHYKLDRYPRGRIFSEHETLREAVAARSTRKGGQYAWIWDQVEDRIVTEEEITRSTPAAPRGAANNPGD